MWAKSENGRITRYEGKGLKNRNVNITVHILKGLRRFKSFIINLLNPNCLTINVLFNPLFVQPNVAP